MRSFPLELLENVLKTLKMNELIKCSRVCKLWKSLIMCKLKVEVLDLRKLNIGNWQWTDGINADSALHFMIPITAESLRSLWLDDKANLNDAIIRMLSVVCPNLIEFTAHVRTLEQILEFPRLHRLSLDTIPCDLPVRPGPKKLAELKHFKLIRNWDYDNPLEFFYCQGLESLAIDGCGYWNLQLVVKSCPFIQRLKISQSFGMEITPLKELKWLNSLALKFCSNIVGIDEVCAARSGTLQCLHFYRVWLEEFKFLRHLVNMSKLVLDDLEHLRISHLEEIPPTAPLKCISVDDSHIHYKQMGEMLIRRRYRLSSITLGYKSVFRAQHRVDDERVYEYCKMLARNVPTLLRIKIFSKDLVSIGPVATSSGAGPTQPE